MKRPLLRWSSTLFMLLLTASSTHAQSKEAVNLTGKVFSEATQKPLAGVQVVVVMPDGTKSGTTDERGMFRIADVVPGTYPVRARSVGYLAFESRVEFRAGAAQQLTIVLPKVTGLDSLRVVGETYTPLSFLENRAAGMGHFITRDDLEKQEGQRLPNILAQVPGLGRARGRSTQGWVMSKRVVPRLSSITKAKDGKAPENTAGTDMYYPDTFDKRNGVVAGCYSRVYLDGTLLNAGTPAEPIDVNQFTTKSIEAIEYYAGPSQTPAKYNNLNSSCGVLVIHSRRSL